jgi:alkanesulfonate monooxygenase SsuD/methylene tetrahydromethanopterin reductase-like flavin-dependent oxidoreductase (luciferase family)
LKVGVQLPEVERVVRRDELAAIARAVEEQGFDSLWVGDHLLYRDDASDERGPWDCFTTLAWLAGITERVELGPLVACTAFHPPGILARQIAAIDELSGGRVVAALGAGWNVPEFEAFGLPFDHHVSRFEEAFTIIRRLLAGERVTFHGSFHETEDALLLPPPARTPKLMVGANRPRMLEITLPHVDSWNTWFSRYGNTVEGFAVENARVDEIAERVGRDPSEIERSACVYVRTGEGGERTHDDDAPPVAAEDVKSHLAGLAEAGADEAILVLDPITEDAVRSLSL